jgi:hypothetical protein
MPLPPFFMDHPTKDNWLKVAKVREAAEAGNPIESAVVLHDEEHLF